MGLGNPPPCWECLKLCKPWFLAQEVTVLGYVSESIGLRSTGLRIVRTRYWSGLRNRLHGAMKLSFEPAHKLQTLTPLYHNI